MVNEARKEELEALGFEHLYTQLRHAGIDADLTRFSKAELIDRLLEAEGHSSEPEPEPEPAEPTEPES